jgi:FkbM family methyltransferase
MTTALELLLGPKSQSAPTHLAPVRNARPKQKKKSLTHKEAKVSMSRENPMRLRSLIGRPIKWTLARVGYDVIPKESYGHDPFLDIERLSQAWQHSIDVFFDVGANEGGTIHRARDRFKNCKITAFEPHPKTFLELTENMKEFRNVELANLALGAEVGNKVMFEYESSALYSLLPDAQFVVRFGNKEARQIEVRCTTLDRFCSDHNIKQIDVLKIDTEGFDFDVLKGASSMLAQQAINFIYFEFNDISPRRDASGGALAPIDQLIRPHGYRFIATYNDYVVPEGELFLVSNALYALPPRRNP